MGLEGAQPSLAELSATGVGGIRVGSALYRTAPGAAPRAARAMREQGTWRSQKKRCLPGRSAHFRVHTLGLG